MRRLCDSSATASLVYYLVAGGLGGACRRGAREGGPLAGEACAWTVGPWEPWQASLGGRMRGDAGAAMALCVDASPWGMVVDGHASSDAVVSCSPDSFLATEDEEAEQRDGGWIDGDLFSGEMPVIDDVDLAGFLQGHEPPLEVEGCPLSVWGESATVGSSSLLGKEISEPQIFDVNGESSWGVGFEKALQTEEWFKDPVNAFVEELGLEQLQTLTEQPADECRPVSVLCRDDLHGLDSRGDDTVESNHTLQNFVSVSDVGVLSVDKEDARCYHDVLGDGAVQPHWKTFVEEFLELIPNAVGGPAIESVNGISLGPGCEWKDAAKDLDNGGISELREAISNVPVAGENMAIVELSAADRALEAEDDCALSGLQSMQFDRTAEFVSSNSPNSKATGTRKESLDVAAQFEGAIRRVEVLDNKASCSADVGTENVGLRKRGSQVREAQKWRVGQGQGWYDNDGEEVLQSFIERPHKRHHYQTDVFEALQVSSESPLQADAAGTPPTAGTPVDSGGRCQIATGIDMDFVGSDCTSEDSGEHVKDSGRHGAVFGKTDTLDKTKLERSFELRNGLLQQGPHPVSASAQSSQLDASAKLCNDDHGEGCSADDACKRELRLVRNRASASESRRRKKSYLTELEGKCRALESQVNHLRQVASITAMENGALRDQLAYFQCYYSKFDWSDKPSTHEVSRASGAQKDVLSCPEGMDGLNTRSLGNDSVAEFAESIERKTTEIGRLSGESKKRVRGRGKTTQTSKSGVMAEPAVLESDSLPPESLPHRHPCQFLLVILSLLPLFLASSCRHLASVYRLFLLLVLAQFTLQKWAGEEKHEIWQERNLKLPAFKLPKHEFLNLRRLFKRDLPSSRRPGRHKMEDVLCLVQSSSQFLAGKPEVLEPTIGGKSKVCSSLKLTTKKVFERLSLNSVNSVEGTLLIAPAA